MRSCTVLLALLSNVQACQQQDDRDLAFILNFLLGRLSNGTFICEHVNCSMVVKARSEKELSHRQYMSLFLGEDSFPPADPRVTCLVQKIFSEKPIRLRQDGYWDYFTTLKNKLYEFTGLFFEVSETVQPAKDFVQLLPCLIYSCKTQKEMLAMLSDKVVRNSPLHYWLETLKMKDLRNICAFMESVGIHEYDCMAAYIPPDQVFQFLKKYVTEDEVLG